MNESKTGGAAFPYVVPPNFIEGEQGMTLRDYFAGQVLAGSFASFSQANGTYEEWKNALENVAPMAYDIADDMIRERNKEDTSE